MPRRAAQFAVDAVASTLLPAAAFPLFVLLPTRADGSIRSGPLATAVTIGVCCTALALVFWYWVLRPAAHDGRTWGMQLFGVRVVDASGSFVSRRQLGVRWLLLVVDGLALGAVGLLAMLLSRRHQRLGDMAARTLVVRGGAPGVL